MVSLYVCFYSVYIFIPHFPLIIMYIYFILLCFIKFCLKDTVFFVIESCVT